MKIFLVCPMIDNQSGKYLHDSLVNMGQKVAFFDFRWFFNEKGAKAMNQELLNATKKLKPDLTLIIKGLGIERETVKEMKNIHAHPIIGWAFDVTLGGTYIKDAPQYIEFIKELTKFYTIDEDAVPELKKLGVNAEWLTEGCYIPDHKEAVYNSIQKRKYGGDVVFLGSVGSIHENRAEYLKKIHEEGFGLKLYGRVFYMEKDEPDWVKDCHTGYEAINDYHSLVCGVNKINIGIDGWTHRSKSWSARLYRTMCAGGFYLTTHTKGIEKYFTPGVHLDTFKTPEELIEKIVKYLNDDELRNKIAKAGQEEVVKKHQFKHRLQKIIDDNTTKKDTDGITFL